jgi:NCAIR mutase (PurE)-related protein
MARKRPIAPAADLGFAKVDLARAKRCGIAEVIYGEGKTPAQVARIARTLHRAGQPVLVTRTSPQIFAAVQAEFPKAVHHETARLVSVPGKTKTKKLPVTLAVCAAGTDDLNVAEECALTAEFLGLKVTRHYDVGVAGLHRLIDRISAIRKADIIVAVAGMEGALTSVLGGLVDRPVIGVPTSVGYGIHLNGLAPLLAMLNSCASGVTVVNINNGFGAAVAAFQIARRIAPSKKKKP